MPTPRALTNVNTRIADRGIAHAIHLRRLQTHEVNKILKFLNDDVFPDLVEQYERKLDRIKTRGPTVSLRSTQRLREMAQSTNALIRAGIGEASQKTQEELGRIALSEARWQTAVLREAVSPLGIDVNVPNIPVLRQAITQKPMQGKLIKEWWGDLSKTTTARINQQITIGLTQGESTQQMVRRLRGTNATPGVFRETRRHVESLVRTSVNHVVTEAREETYKENTNVVGQVKYLATLDGRTTITCASLDGQVFPVGEGPRPPQHINCRSTTVPVLLSWEAMGIKANEVDFSTRAAFDGAEPAKTTYPEWLKRQSVDTQNQVLGVKRAQLFRSGKVSFNKFVDQRNRPLSLEQLAKVEGIEL